MPGPASELPPSLARCAVADVLAELQALVLPSDLPQALTLFSELFRHLVAHHRRAPRTSGAVYRAAAGLAASRSDSLRGLDDADRGRAAALAAELVAVADAYSRTQPGLRREVVGAAREALARTLAAASGG